MIGFTTGLSGAMLPGPLFVYTVSEALKKDARVGLKIILGHILIEAVFVIFIFVGFKDHLQSRSFIGLTSFVGGFALIGMGGILLRNVPQMSLVTKCVEINFDYGAVTGGAFFSIISPGFLIWWTTIGVSLVLEALLIGLAGLAVLAIGHWLADIGWYWFIAYFVNKGKCCLKDMLYQKLIRLLALILIAMGMYFILAVFPV
jgi:threonine/homoserine/homoserine lactone efflux protein